MTFEAYAAAGFGEDLLPILPPDATINPESQAYDNLMASRGKVPGKLSKDGWFGFGGWTTNTSTVTQRKQWSAWGCGIGLQGRNFPAIDIDIDGGALADEILREAVFAIGLGPVRTGRAGRLLTAYAGKGLRKRRLAFRVPRGPSDPAPDLARGGAELPEPGRVVDDVDPGDGSLGPVYAVEFLGDGQQYIIEGIHPKTGRPYTWREGQGLLDFGAAGLTPVTDDDLDDFFARVVDLVLARGGEIVRHEGGGGSGDRTSVEQGGLRAPSLEAVREALAVIDNDVDYDDWIKIAAAVKAATEGLEDA